MITAEEIFEQAMRDDFAILSKGTMSISKHLYDCKIINWVSTGYIEILNTGKGDWYEPLTPDELKIFSEKGWRAGVYNVTLSNYRSKLDVIEADIKHEMNTKANPKKITALKNARSKTLNMYTKIKRKQNEQNSI